jgi:hypothetical protein
VEFRPIILGYVIPDDRLHVPYLRFRYRPPGHAPREESLGLEIREELVEGVIEFFAQYCPRPFRVAFEPPPEAGRGDPNPQDSALLLGLREVVEVKIDEGTDGIPKRPAEVPEWSSLQNLSNSISIAAA